MPVVSFGRMGGAGVQIAMLSLMPRWHIKYQAVMALAAAGLSCEGLPGSAHLKERHGNG
jgi:hypothetical protein